MNRTAFVQIPILMKSLYVTLFQCQIIIDWLEKSAADENDRQEKPSIEHFTDKTVLWENTLSQLKVTSNK